MSDTIKPRNLMAQVLHRSVGNPVNTLPISAISNCFPGLEFDFKVFWRRAFVGIVLLEWDNYVIETDDNLTHLQHHRLLRIEGRDVVTTVSGPQIPSGQTVALSGPAICMEWSNALAFVMQRQGQKVRCEFTIDEANDPVPIPADGKLLPIELTVRKMFDGDTAAPALDLLNPGEMTQGLCSPWQHDYRECACYYWPATRPDYVNVVPTSEGISTGDNWMSKERTGEYVLDDRKDSRLLSYDDLFIEWEKLLLFQVKGRDAEES
jgi:hypothetical protein